MFLLIEISSYSRLLSFSIVSLIEATVYLVFNDYVLLLSIYS